MPTPNPKETKPNFISRCIADVTGEGRTPEKAAAICHSIWESKKSEEDSKDTECKGCGYRFDSSMYPEVSMGAVKCPNCGSVIDQKGNVVKNKSIVIKVLNHKIHKSEPSLMVNNSILINTPDLNKGIEVDSVLLSHTHKDNLSGFGKIKTINLIKVYSLKQHEHFLEHHVKNIEEISDMKCIEPYKDITIEGVLVTPILTKHEVQKIYGDDCLGFILDKKVGICIPCNSILQKSLEALKNVDVLIIDGGYRTKEMYKNHKSILKTLREFKDSKVKYIYFLGTHQDYKIRGILKGTSIKIDTLFAGDLLKINV